MGLQESLISLDQSRVYFNAKIGDKPETGSTGAGDMKLGGYNQKSVVCTLFANKKRRSVLSLLPSSGWVVDDLQTSR